MPVPTCRKATLRPSPSSPERSIREGVASHITGASPQGPRYDPSLAPEQRKAATNGIWTCSTCGKVIDNDPDSFPASVLRHWKANAERRAVRDSAATPDVIAELLEELANARDQILEFVVTRKHEDAVIDFEDGWQERIAARMLARQAAFQSEMTPRIRNLLVRAQAILGPDDPEFLTAEDVAGYAHTNPLVMAEMAKAFENLRTVLELR